MNRLRSRARVVGVGTFLYILVYLDTPVQSTAPGAIDVTLGVIVRQVYAGLFPPLATDPASPDLQLTHRFDVWLDLIERCILATHPPAFGCPALRDNGGPPC